MKYQWLASIAVTTMVEAISGTVATDQSQSRQNQHEESATVRNFRAFTKPINEDSELSSSLHNENLMILDELWIDPDTGTNIDEVLQRDLATSSWQRDFLFQKDDNKKTQYFSNGGEKGGNHDDRRKGNHHQQKEYAMNWKYSVEKPSVWATQDAAEKHYEGQTKFAQGDKIKGNEKKEKTDDKSIAWPSHFYLNKPKSGKKGQVQHKMSWNGNKGPNGKKTGYDYKKTKIEGPKGVKWYVPVDEKTNPEHNIFRPRVPGDNVLEPRTPEEPAVPGDQEEPAVPETPAEPLDPINPEDPTVEIPEDFGERFLSFPTEAPSPAPEPTRTPTPTTSSQPSEEPTRTPTPTTTPQPSPRPTPPGETPNPTPPGGTPKPTPQGGTPNPTPQGGTSKPTPPGGTPNPTPSGGTPNPTPPGGTPKPTPPGGTPKPTPRGGTPNPTPFRPTDPTQPPRTPKPTPSPVFTPFPTFGETTFQPTVDCLSNTTREEFLLDLLSAVTPSAELLDISTPQGQAFNFMVNIDTGTDVCTYPTLEQRYALATLFYATDGTNWDNSEGWLSPSSECDWFGIECDNLLLVIRVLLRRNSLVGILPNEIGVLIDTRRIDMFDNNLTSTIPSGIGGIGGLRVLDLEFNQMTGEIFTEDVLSLVRLQSLRCSDNDFDGTIPPAIVQLADLRELWLGENELTGFLPTELGAITGLQTLLIFNNTMSGAIPSEIGNLGSLSDLRLNGNEIVQSIPIELYNLADLKKLHLNNNFITGTIATEIGNLLLMSDLRLNNNFIGETIPSEIGLLTDLVFFLTHNNFLEGSIPDVFGGLSELDTMDVSTCNHDGPIPPSLFEIDSLRLVYMFDNVLTGPIPESYSSPPLLRDFYVHNNMLNGTVPEIDAGELMFLTEFLLQGNSITGSMPTSICTLRDNVTGILEVLWADCGGQEQEIQCDFPACCTMCFSSVMTASRQGRDAW